MPQPAGGRVWWQDTIKFLIVAWSLTYVSMVASNMTNSDRRATEVTSLSKLSHPEKAEIAIEGDIINAADTDTEPDADEAETKGTEASVDANQEQAQDPSLVVKSAEANAAAQPLQDANPLATWVAQRCSKEPLGGGLRKRRGKGFCWRGTLGESNRIRIREFYPPVEELDGGGQCFACRKGLKALARLMQKGCLSRQPVKCGRMKEFGFGAMVNSMVKTATVAMAYDTPFVWANLSQVWGGGNPAGTKKENLVRTRIKPTAYFHSDAVPCHRDCSRITNKEKEEVWLMETVCKRRCRKHMVSIEPYYKSIASLRGAMDTPYSDLFWWSAELLRLFMTPNEAVTKLVAKLKSDLSFEDHKPVLAVHIRLGDSCGDIKGANVGRNCDGLDSYLPHIKRMVETYGYKGIFLATDDNDLRKSAAKRLSGIPAKVMTAAWGTPVFKNKAGKKIVVEQATFGFAVRVGTQFMAESLVLAECQGFVGKFSSNVFRNVYTLASIQEGNYCLHPVASIDSPYCLDYGFHAGVNCENSKKLRC